MIRYLCLATVFLVSACTTENDVTETGTVAFFDAAADLSQPEQFFDFPFPSDIRLTAAGAPDMKGFPNPKKSVIVKQFLSVVERRKGFPVVPVAFFRFSAAVAAQEAESVIPALKDSPVLLVDVDENSPERGRLFPTVAATPAADDFVPENFLAVAPRPGFILSSKRKYAFVILRSMGDEAGKPLGVPYLLTRLRTSDGPRELNELYAPLWTTLRQIGVPGAQVAAATVFTTGDVVADMATLSDALLKKFSIEITDLKVDPDDGAAHPRFCELVGKVRYPQFQTGIAPFDEGGVFVFEDGESGLPKQQRLEEAPITITFPNSPMPAAGYPLMVYFHGSGGVSGAVVDRGRFIVALGMNEIGKGPAHVLAPFGLATAASALPVNPERVPGAGETAYLNLGNVAAFPDTFHQGAIEQRLFIKALKNLSVPQSVLAAGGCTGPTTPAGVSAFKFAPEQLVAQGQSMGGMYTNMIGAIEPRIKAVVPTGAGGYWSYFILKTSLIEGADKLLGVLLNTKSQLTFMHPVMQLMQISWESVDPIVYMPRLARDPLPGHPVRPIYEPVGKGDSYFPTVLYDAVALAYHHQQTGDDIWPSMQEALKLDGLDGILPYPLKNNAKSIGGVPYTGAVVQYEGDGEYDPHALYTQLDTVKYQYGCFFDTFLKTGTALILKPKPLGSACE